jgi:exonuclease V gamma subunit
MAPLDAQAAHAVLENLVALWRANLDRPLAVACKTALAHLAGGDPREVYDGGFEINGEVDDPCLARRNSPCCAPPATGRAPPKRCTGRWPPGCATASA